MKKVVTLIGIMTIANAVLLTAAPKTEVNSKDLEGIQPIKGVQEKANKILYKAGAYLKKAKTFQFKADISRDVILYDGVRVEYSGISNVIVQRPNKFRAIFNGDERARRTYFNGKNLLIYSKTRNIFIQKEINGTIDDAIDHIFEKFGFSIPLADIVYADLYSVLIENIDSGYYVGEHKIDGILCDHLSFQQDVIDWQIWIESGDKPFIRKILISYKEDEGSPEYEAELSGWKINISFKDSDFNFTPPIEAEEIEFLPLKNLYGENDPILEVK